MQQFIYFADESNTMIMINKWKKNIIINDNRGYCWVMLFKVTTIQPTISDDAYTSYFFSPVAL